MVIVSFSLKPEHNPPVRPHRHRPEAAKLALERMQPIAGEFPIGRLGAIDRDALANAL
jgi:hypothetical protein